MLVSRLSGVIICPEYYGCLRSLNWPVFLHPVRLLSSAWSPLLDQSLRSSSRQNEKQVWSLFSGFPFYYDSQAYPKFCSIFKAVILFILSSFIVLNDREFTSYLLFSESHCTKILTVVTQLPSPKSNSNLDSPRVQFFKCKKNKKDFYIKKTVNLQLFHFNIIYYYNVKISILSIIKVFFLT